MPVPPVPQTLGASGVALFCLALACWLICLLLVFSVAGKQVHGDAVVGQAFAWLWAMGFAGLTFLWIGGLLLKAGTEDVLPARGIVLVLYLASGVAGTAAMFLLTDVATRVWPVTILILLPAILIFYPFALYQPVLRPLFSGPQVSLFTAGFVLLLCVAPLPSTIHRLSRTRQNSAAVGEAVASRTREENLAKLQAMPADAPLWDWLDLLQEKSGVRTEALQAVRTMDRRQNDTVELLEAGVPRAFRLIPDLDLQASQSLCDAANSYLRKYAKESRVRPKQDPREYRDTYVEESVPTLQWLMSHGCNCDETIAVMQASVETFLDTPAREAALTAIANLRRR